MCKRIGIILGYDIPKEARSPLKYFLLHLNTLQQTFEYQFPPTIRHSILVDLADGQIKEKQKVKKALHNFLNDYEGFLSQKRKDYKLENTEPNPDYYILITIIKFSDLYYLTGIDRLGVLAQGNWEIHMAPPSLLESIITMVLVESVYLFD